MTPTALLAYDMSEDTQILRLAREIAMDIHGLPEILNRCSVSEAQWELIKASPRFQKLLATQMEMWNSAANTGDRIKIKAAAIIEESLPEFFAKMHGPDPLNAKVEVLKTIAKLAEVGQDKREGAPGEKVSVVINIGSNSIRINKELPTQVIDHEPQALTVNNDELWSTM